jgi:hypothetical protein
VPSHWTWTGRRRRLARDAAEVERAPATVIRAIEGRYLPDAEAATSP